MTISRYTRTPILALGRRYGSSTAIQTIRAGILSGDIKYTEHTLAGRERLDIIAGQKYGDGKYWWIIAAASDIGWAPQVPPGTLLYIPDLQDVLRLVG